MYLYKYPRNVLSLRLRSSSNLRHTSSSTWVHRIAMPTLTLIYAIDLRDARDAHIVFEAVRLNILPLVTRRLTTVEREQLTSGNVFVWEEAEHKGGLERWTDGRRWWLRFLFIIYICKLTR